MVKDEEMKARSEKENWIDWLEFVGNTDLEAYEKVENHLDYLTSPVYVLYDREGEEISHNTPHDLLFDKKADWIEQNLKLRTEETVWNAQIAEKGYSGVLSAAESLENAGLGALRVVNVQSIMIVKAAVPNGDEKNNVCGMLGS